MIKIEQIEGKRREKKKKYTRINKIERNYMPFKA